MRQNGSSVTGNSDLSAVRVPGQLQIDGMLCRPIREIRFMHNDDLAFARRDFLERLIQVIRVQINVVYPNDPEPLTVSFQWHGFIAQNSETTAIEGIGDEIGAVQMVVVAENRHDARSWRSSGQSSGQLLQNFRAGLGMASTLNPIGLEERMRDEIASKNVEIRFEREGKSDRAFDLSFPCVRSEMHVAHKGDAKSMERFRQVPKTNVDVLGDGNMRLDQETIHGGDGA
jgi:hypothetical protein